MTHPLRSGRLRRSTLPAYPLLLAGLIASLPSEPAAAQQALFGAAELEQQRFVLVAAPIGSSTRYQLNIYEQVSDRRPCFATATTLPAPVNPLLASFDFTGICSRYIDANGYSLRVGGSDLATSYRLMVRSEAGGTVLVALPTRTGAGPEMIVARSGGAISGFHKLEPEPGWRLMRRTYGGRRLGHVYVYNDTWPVAATLGSPAAAAPGTTAPATPITGTPATAPGSGAVPTPVSGSPTAPAPAAAAGPAQAAPTPPVVPPGGAPAAMPLSGAPATPPAAPPSL